MALYIKTHPNPGTLIARAYAENAPEGYQESTEAAADAWVAEELAAGWVPTSEPLEPAAPPIPASIANWRAKAAVELAGLTSAVESAMQALPEPARTVALAAWENGADLDRHGPTVLALSAALSLTEAQVDNLFLSAASLTV